MQIFNSVFELGRMAKRMRRLETNADPAEL